MSRGDTATSLTNKVPSDTRVLEDEVWHASFAVSIVNEAACCQNPERRLEPAEHKRETSRFLNHLSFEALPPLLAICLGIPILFKLLDFSWSAVMAILVRHLLELPGSCRDRDQAPQAPGRWSPWVLTPMYTDSTFWYSHSSSVHISKSHGGRDLRGFMSINPPRRGGLNW